MPSRSQDQLSLFEKAMLGSIPHVAASLIDGWCRTYRVVERINEGRERSALLASGGAVYATWHQRMFYFFHDFGRRNIIMMIGRSKDGDYADAIAHLLGFQSVRGSRVRDGHRAMYELVKRLSRGAHAAGMMGDGPNGPPRVLKGGTVRIAKMTGKPIIPMMYGARRTIILGSWDRYMVPMPFTDIVVYHGNPVYVPGDANKGETEGIRVEVERTLNEMADVCDSYWGGLPIGKPGFDL
ncbi:MAG TPA: DUF374 domain-containing protein [Deltaproteobacteria bacterium]|jgi:hypothetical protein|nr:DUF374 domain-containing protein [Deltaproteobacteria bacterium]HOI06681.1 DUF374 domain-containing protein [Deltaproteobacteria bacterium]